MMTVTRHVSRDRGRFAISCSRCTRWGAMRGTIWRNDSDLLRVLEWVTCGFRRMLQSLFIDNMEIGIQIDD
jgi:hypothetical protein